MCPPKVRFKPEATEVDSIKAETGAKYVLFVPKGESADAYSSRGELSPMTFNTVFGLGLHLLRNKAARSNGWLGRIA